jgi:hypothetical protein
MILKVISEEDENDFVEFRVEDGLVEEIRAELGEDASEEDIARRVVELLLAEATEGEEDEVDTVDD